jgi:simple sugar transport system permease protein
MAQLILKRPQRGSAPPALAGIGRAWGRISSGMVPVLAVVTALLITIPFMIVTGGRGDIARGLNIAGTAYAALLEGSLGLVINDQLSPDDLALFYQYAVSLDDAALTQSDLRALERAMNDLIQVDAETAFEYALIFGAFPKSDGETLTELGQHVAGIRAIGEAALDAMRPLIAELDAADRGDVRALAEAIRGDGELSPDNLTALTALAPSAASIDSTALLESMRWVDEYGVVRLTRFVDALDSLRAQEIWLDTPTLTILIDLSADDAPITLDSARDLTTSIEQLEASGIPFDQAAALESQIAVVRALYEADLLSDDNVLSALDTQLPAVLQENLVVRRPGDRLVIDRDSRAFGTVYNAQNTPDDPTDDRVEVNYARIGGSALLFFPANLESMIVRAIPFIIAGLAVALGFKAGLFNIGAEGQLYAGATLAVWVAFSPIFASLPALIHIPLVLVMGILGGALWGAIPGALKAYTGAHEVIVTIMLNYIAVLIVDWLIKSTTPIILLDPTASTPRTPFISPSAALPRFDTLHPALFIVAGVAVASVWLFVRRAEIARDARAAIRPIAYGVLVVIGGLFLQYISVRGALHVGFVIMLLAVWFTDWFLSRTTLGFELRTVGSNPDAARYAGMSVPRSIILAMALSGALAGLAGTIEVSGVQLNMQPEFFSGLGFDAIAVALLARNNIRNMIFAGLLWGALLGGAGLMQLRADISIDLVKIIQALIIMFIAADAIIRYLWAIPKPTEKTSVSTFSKGWGG